MKKIIFLMFSILFSLQLNANNSFNSEISHVAGGTLLAGGVTAIVDSFPQYKVKRGMIGFGVSTAAGVIDFAVESITAGDIKGQLLDLVSHTLGSIFGAWVTDKYILAPVVEDSPVQGKYLGCAMAYHF